uniref:Uncharacterized protein n=1 Tax=Glycine max TaxID=3847 RepID=C6T3D0_SOYBN|nr:unknown [Glycine max]
MQFCNAYLERHHDPMVVFDALSSPTLHICFKDLFQSFHDDTKFEPNLGVFLFQIWFLYY